MGGRGRSSGKGMNQILVDQVIQKNKIDQIISKANEIRALMESNGSGGSGSPALLKKCACCGEYTIPTNTQYEVCSICGWIDDPYQNNHPDSRDGANPISLNEAKPKYKNPK